MMDHYYLDLTLICLCLVFAMICIFIAIMSLKQRNKIVQALQKSNIDLKANLESNQLNLKKAIENLPDDAISNCIGEIHLIEKDSLKKLISLVVDNDAGAIEMAPFLMNQIIAKYIHCVKLIALASLVPTAVVEPEEDIEKFQYESLIEQLRQEKHDYAEQYKSAQNLLSAIYLNYKDKLGMNSECSLESLSLEEMAVVFGLEWTPPKTEYY